MPNLLMESDSFRFEQIVINRLIRPGLPGSFALGTKDDKGEFVPKFVGRSDIDLRGDLMAKAGVPQYPYFKFAIMPPPAAYEIECVSFHSYQRKLDNKTHPVSPAGMDLNCFLCGR